MRILFFALIAVTMGFFRPGMGNSEVNVNIVMPLPGPVIPAPPGLIVIPGTYVYYPPEITMDIFFYRGFWYRPYRGGWYRAGSYNGPWRSIHARRVPGAVHKVPPAYRRVPSRHAPVSYGDVRKNWRSWERDHYWERRYEKRRSHGMEKREYEDRDGRGRGRGRGHEKHDRG